MALSLRRRPKTFSRHQCRRIVRLLHRSCSFSFVDWRTVDVFLEYVLPRLNCSIRGCFTSTWPVSFSGQTAHHYLLQPPSPVLPWIVLLPHFHFREWPKPVIPLSFGILASSCGKPHINARLFGGLLLKIEGCLFWTAHSVRF